MKHVLIFVININYNKSMIRYDNNVLTVNDSKLNLLICFNCLLRSCKLYKCFNDIQKYVVDINI